MRAKHVPTRLALGLLSKPPGAEPERSVAPPRLLSVGLTDRLSRLFQRKKPMAKVGVACSRSR
ncbi:hypothetical protein IMCC21224_11412 [Puniceibacterium sp. IMCC21224]|nr:hypothetical protein IMCC21224_11412 [Puniceibacterium sp. IMCC21224]